MIIFDICNKIRDFIQENVSPEIELKKPNEGDTNTFELVHPAVYATHRPRPQAGRDFLLVPSITVIVPSVSESTDNAFSSAPVRLLFLIGDPGQQIRLKQEDGSYGPLEFTPATEGWRDLATAMDATVRFLRNDFSKTGMSIAGDIKTSLFGVDADGNPLPEFADYSAGWVDFTVSHGVMRNPNWSKLL